MAVKPVKHGVASTYQKGCRCDVCRDYNASMRRRQRATNKKVQAYGKGYAAATYIAASRYREDQPEQWRALLAEQVQLAAEGGS
jgi:hypothetical protein